MNEFKVIWRCFRLSSLRRRHARQRAAGRAGSRAQWRVWQFDHAGSAGALGSARFKLLASGNSTGSRYKKMPCAGASGAERTAREKIGACHRPSARLWPGYVRRGTGGASNCTYGLNYGPGTAKSAQMDIARGFARWLLRDDPDTDHGIFSVRLTINRLEKMKFRNQLCATRGRAESYRMKLVDSPLDSPASPLQLFVSAAS